MNALELSELRKTTAVLIREDPTVVTITQAGTKARTASGGMASVGASETLDPVKRYFAPVSRDNRLEIDWKGRKVVASHILIGLRDDEDIKEGGTFLVEGEKYEIVFVNRDRRWQTKGYVINA